MDEWYSLLILLVVAGGISALRWWIEKQRREEEARESAKRPPGRRAAPPPLPASAVKTAARRGVGPRTIFHGRPGEVRAKAVDVPEKRPLAAEPPPVEKVGALERHLLARPMRSMLEGRGAAALETGATAKGALGGGRFVSEMLRPKHLAGAIIVREVLGPPKSLEGTDILPR